MSLLEMSIFGAIMIVAVIVIRALSINHLPKKTFIALWGIVLLRLLLPFSIPSPFSVYSLVANHISAPRGNTVLISPAMPDSLLTMGDPLQGHTMASISPYAIIWVIGVVSCALFFTIAYFKCRREFRESLPVTNEFLTEWTANHKLARPTQIRQSSRISAPLTYGVFRPIILMPKSTNWNDTKHVAYILAHEFVHVKRFDAATKLCLTAALCIHWFNPFVWAMYVLSNRDIELSCDEAVIRSFGDATKSAYARTLISMEESKSRLTPLYNHFSKNAIEERITAIMKMKRTSIAALVAAILLIGGVTTVFATSANNKQDSMSHTQQADRNANVQNSKEILNTSLMSHVDEATGITMISEDGGKKWVSQDEFDTANPQATIEWWTYDSYKSWLSEETVRLNNMLGEQGYTQEKGWFTWTQTDIEKAVLLYESILEDINNGLFYSKKVDGNENNAMVMSVNKEDVANGSSANIISDATDAGQAGNGFSDYKDYGLTYESNTDSLYYHGELVRYFCDGAPLDKNAWSIRHQHFNEKGTVDVFTKRTVIDLGNGGKDPFGDLIGLEKSSQTEFAKRDLSGFTASTEQTAHAAGDSNSAEGITFAEAFAKYKPFGIEYKEERAGSGYGNVYLNGELVKSFIDEAKSGNVFSYASKDGGTITVQTVYDSNGNLTDVEKK